MKWNYSGWQSKSVYSELLKLSEHIKGDFSDGRVIYENNEYSNAAGTVRVFEMLPYFAGRSTLESVYMQATVLAPAAFYLQAVVSKTPSCPFPNYQCTNYDISRMKDYAPLMGISDYIFITPEVRAQADEATFLKKSESFAGWHVYSMKEKPSLVDVWEKPVKWIGKDNYKREFYDWFQKYSDKSEFLIVDRFDSKKFSRRNGLKQKC